MTLPAPTPLPMSRADMRARGWEELDVLLVTGDAYVDHPTFGAAMIGRVLEAEGFRVGVVAQPDWKDAESLNGMGRPRLFCGITAGNLDSMLAHYSAARHRRKEDDYSPGGEAGLRPNHASVVYAQLARRKFPKLPIVLGGIEASLRRVAHYDFWEDKIRPSVLADSKAQIVVYGMGETAVCEVAHRLRRAADDEGGEPDWTGIPGTAYLLGGKASEALLESLDPKRDLLLPSFEAVRDDWTELRPLTRKVEREQSPFCGKRLIQLHGERAMVMERPALPLTSEQMDRLYAFPFTRRPHPAYGEAIPAFTMIRDSVTVVRGCPAGCTFCAIGFHQGKFLSSRSKASVLQEITTLAEEPDFRGTISDLGGPTANTYGTKNGAHPACLVCRRPSCYHPKVCKVYEFSDEEAIDLLRAAKALPGIRHLFVQSGIRLDIALLQPDYLRELIHNHVSGHMKVAPEHLAPEVLKRMRKGQPGEFDRFMEVFQKESRAAGKEQYVVPYFMSSFPGCTEEEMGVVEKYLGKTGWRLQQVQDFIPLPMTPSAAMYATGLDYDNGQPIPIARGTSDRAKQKAKLQKSQGRGRR